MRALTTVPLHANTLEVVDVPDPEPRKGDLLVDAIAVGVCGTDKEIARGEYGWAPPGRERLVLGHESLGRVREAPEGSGFAAGDLVAGVVRRPDPEPCGACAHGEFDMCRNGEYTERGIKQIDGFMSEHWRIEPEYAVKVDPGLGLLGVLLEPTTVVAKAWEQVSLVGQRAFWEPQHVLVTGAGPIGLLAALLGRHRGLDVHVLDRVTTGPKPELVAALGATYHSGTVAELGFEPDIVIECTGVGQVIADSMRHVAAGGVVCLTGIGSGGRTSSLPAADMASALVLQNNVVVGSVNANKRHWYKATQVLAQADRGWLSRLITRREGPEAFMRALQRQPGDIKTVIQFSEA